MSKWYEKHGTTTEFAGVIIGTFVAGFTIALFFQTKKSTDAAIKAANAADNTYKEQRFNDGVLRRRDSINAIANEDNERRRFSLDSTSTQAQIQSIKEAQKQFEVENEPYLQIEVTSIDTPFLKGKPISIKYDIKNLKINPVKIIIDKGAFEITDARPDKFDVFKKKSKGANFNVYTTKESPYKTGGILPTEARVFNAVAGGKSSVFILNDIEYIDLLSSKKRFYKSIIKITITNFPYFTTEFIYNENGYISFK